MKSRKIDILYGKVQKECVDCGDPFGTIFAVDGGICTAILCFQCIVEHLENDGFEN